LLYLKGHVFMSETASVATQKSQESGIQSVPGTQGTTQAHVQGIIQIHKSEFPPYPNLFRVGCSCGRYKGCWQSSPQLAFASHARHVNGARVEFR
jgi:hypothetical protein